MISTAWACLRTAFSAIDETIDHQCRADLDGIAALHVVSVCAFASNDKGNKSSGQSGLMETGFLFAHLRDWSLLQSA